MLNTFILQTVDFLCFRLHNWCLLPEEMKEYIIEFSDSGSTLFASQALVCSRICTRNPFLGFILASRPGLQNQKL